LKSAIKKYIRKKIVELVTSDQRFKNELQVVIEKSNAEHQKVIELLNEHQLNFTKIINKVEETTIAEKNNLSVELKNQFKNEINTEVAKIYNLDPCFDFYGKYGHAISTSKLTIAEKQAIFVNFQHKEKAKVALSVATSYSGGHYLEFGSHDLYTLRNFLSAFDVGALDARYPETNFYAFDIFGSYDEKRWNQLVKTEQHHHSVKSYFDDFTPQGDILPEYQKVLNDYDLFTNRVHLIKGFFEDTIPKFKLEGKVGFVCIDCNVLESYQVVYKYILDKVKLGTYIYVDEYFDNFIITQESDKFSKTLTKEHNLKMKFVRSAGSVGALFRIVKS
jgi:hypothetical protein